MVTYVWHVWHKCVCFSGFSNIKLVPNFVQTVVELQGILLLLLNIKAISFQIVYAMAEFNISSLFNCINDIFSQMCVFGLSNALPMSSRLFDHSTLSTPSLVESNKVILTEHDLSKILSRTKKKN